MTTFRMTTRQSLLAALLLATALIAFVRFEMAPWNDKKRDKPAYIDRLVEQLRAPANKVQYAGYRQPGGEMLHYSAPMRKLIALGDAARGPLYRRLSDEQIQNEVVLILGAIGDDSTVPLLIDAYPDIDVPEPTSVTSEPGAAQLKLICFSYALTYLTHEPISRNRWGTDYTPGNRQKWQEWWARDHKVFWVCDGCGRAIYIPGNPPSPRTLKSAPQVLAQLNKALQDEDAEVREAAVRKFYWLGPQAKDAVPNLLVALQDEDAKVRAAAASIFTNLGPAADEAVPALLEAMFHDKDRRVRCSAANSLARVGERPIPHLVKALQDEDADIRRRAASAIGAHDPKRKDLIPALLALAHDEDPGVRCSVLGSLKELDSGNPQVFSALLEGLADPVPDVRRGCAYLFWEIGWNAAPATKALIALLQDKDAGVRRETLNALVKIGSLTHEQVPLLMAFLQDDDSGMRSDAAKALEQIGPGAKAAVESLRRALKDPHRSVRWWAATALGGIGPDAKSAIPDLLNALKDDESLVRRCAKEALISRNAPFCVHFAPHGKTLTCSQEL
jgi:HEAT repeat protein